MKYLKRYINAIGESHISDEDDEHAVVKYTKEQLYLLANYLNDGDFEVRSVRYFDKYQGAYGYVRILDHVYKIWIKNDFEFYIDNFKIDNCSSKGQHDGFEGEYSDISDAIEILKMSKDELIQEFKSKINWKIVNAIEYALTEYTDTEKNISAVVAFDIVDTIFNSSEKTIYNIINSKYEVSPNDVYNIKHNSDIYTFHYIILWFNNSYDEILNISNRLSKKMKMEYKIYTKLNTILSIFTEPLDI